METLNRLANDLAVQRCAAGAQRMLGQGFRLGVYFCQSAGHLPPGLLQLLKYGAQLHELHLAGIGQKVAAVGFLDEKKSADGVSYYDWSARVVRPELAAWTKSPRLTWRCATTPSNGATIRE